MRILFIDYHNGFRFNNPEKTLVITKNKISKRKLRKAENVTYNRFTGGVYSRILDYLEEEYIVVENDGVYDKKFELTTGNY